jgi:predicted lipoprotein with Yx(FWY)xxD motif
MTEREIRERIEEDDVAASRLIATVAGCVAAAVALAGLTACAPRGADAGAGYDPAAAQQQAPPQALSEILGESAAPVSSAPPAKLTTALKAQTIPKMGKVVTDQEGFVLYRFDKDSAKPPTTNCIDKCAAIWPPALTDGNSDLSGVDAAVVGAVQRPDGTRQITLAGWPVYRYIGDPKPGTWKGQNVGGTWFVVAPDGKKNLTCLPTPAPTAVQPPGASAPAGDPTATNGDGGTGGY